MGWRHHGAAQTPGTHLGLPEVLDSTGLSDAAPPEGVHAMARGASHAGGAYDLADMVIEGLEQADAPPGPRSSRPRLWLLIRLRGSRAGGGLPGRRVAWEGAQCSRRRLGA